MPVPGCLPPLYDTGGAKNVRAQSAARSGSPRLSAAARDTQRSARAPGVKEREQTDGRREMAAGGCGRHCPQTSRPGVGQRPGFEACGGLRHRPDTRLGPRGAARSRERLLRLCAGAGRERGRRRLHRDPAVHAHRVESANPRGREAPPLREAPRSERCGVSETAVGGPQVRQGNQLLQLPPPLGAVQADRRHAAETGDRAAGGGGGPSTRPRSTTRPTRPSGTRWE